MLPKAICPACVDSLKRQGITNPVVEFVAVGEKLFKCSNCWHLVSSEVLGGLMELQNELESHDRARDELLMAAMIGGKYAPTSKNR